MAFTLEDGTGVVGANAYIDVTFFKDYHKDRGTIISAGSGDIQTAIVRATDYIERTNDFIGTIASSEQGLKWPRINVADERGASLADTVPEAVQQACAEYAKRELDGNSLYQDGEILSRGRVTEEASAVGPISESFKYQQGSSTTTRPIPEADDILERSGLVIGGGGQLLRA